MSTNTVLRHTKTVRWSHWLIAISGILLLFSGFGQLPMYKRYKLVDIPGFAWASNYEITLLLHYFFGALFTAAVVYHIVYHLRRNEKSIMPRKGDIAESITGLKAMFGLGEAPCHEKFQAKQRMAYAVIGLTSLVLILTGLIKSWKNLGAIIIDPTQLQLVTLAHTLFGMAFMMLFFAHVGVLILKEHRPLVPSMFTGRIKKEYVDEHLPCWKVE